MPAHCHGGGHGEDGQMVVQEFGSGGFGTFKG